MAKNPPANAGDSGDAVSIPGSERSPGVGNSNPLQYSYLKNSMDRGAWRAISSMGSQRAEYETLAHTNTHTHTWGDRC